MLRTIGFVEQHLALQDQTAQFFLVDGRFLERETAGRDGGDWRNAVWVELSVCEIHIDIVVYHRRGISAEKRPRWSIQCKVEVRAPADQPIGWIIG
jgi:hypothetical protein